MKVVYPMSITEKEKQVLKKIANKKNVFNNPKEKFYYINCLYELLLSWLAPLALIYQTAVAVIC